MARTFDDFSFMVREIAVAVAYHRGAAMTYNDILGSLRLRMNVEHAWVPRRLCEAAELAGFPVWSSAPDEAMRPW
jgi:hypothetical protein